MDSCAGCDKDIGALGEVMYGLGFRLEYLSAPSRKLHLDFKRCLSLLLLVLHVHRI